MPTLWYKITGNDPLSLANKSFTQELTLNHIIPGNTSVWITGNGTAGIESTEFL